MQALFLTGFLAVAAIDTVPNLPLLEGMKTAASERFASTYGAVPLPAGTDAPVAVRPALRIVSGADPLPRDAWLAEDKLKHFFLSFAITAFAYSSARAAGVDDSPALASAVVTSMAAGVGKEIYDLRAEGRFSVRDLVWDLAGIALGAALLRETR